MVFVLNGTALAMSGGEFKFKFYANELPEEDEVVFLGRVSAENLQPMEIVDEVSAIAVKLAEFSAKRHASARTRSFGTYAVTLRNLLKDAMISEEDCLAILETYNAVYAGLSNVNTRSAKRINALLSALNATLAQGGRNDDNAEGDHENDNLAIVIKEEKVDDVINGALGNFSTAISSASIEQQEELKKVAVEVLNIALGSDNAGSSGLVLQEEGSNIFYSSSVVENSDSECSYKKLFDSLEPIVPSWQMNTLLECGVIVSPVVLAALVVLACDNSLIEESLFVATGVVVSGFLKFAIFPFAAYIEHSDLYAKNA